MNSVAWSNARKKRGKNRKIDLIKQFGGGCTKCNYNKCLSGLTFHHRDPKTKLFTLDQSNLYKYKLETILQEATKCDLLCQNCHAILHEEERNLNRSLNKWSQYKFNKSVNRKQEIIKLLGNKCLSCNFTSLYLQPFCFHHREDKLFELNILNLRSKSDKAIQIEVAKCDLLCLNCHHELHFQY